MMTDLKSLFADIEAKTEKLAEPIGFEAEWLAREERWLKKKIGKLSSSICPKLMQKGRSKGEEWGKDAIKILLTVAHERRTGIARPQIRGVKALEWGKQYEGESFEFYCKKTGIAMKSGTFGFDEIVLIEPMDGFVDSPDGITEDRIGRAEAKVPENGAIHYEYTTIKSISESDDYYYQFLGHLIDPVAEWCDFYSYDPRSDENDPLKYVVVRVWKMDHKVNIDRLIKRIELGNKVINEALEKNDMSIILNINNRIDN